jgi:hypothetical protein
MRKNPSPNFPRNSPNFLNPFSIFFPYFPFSFFFFFFFFFFFPSFLHLSSSFGGSYRDPQAAPPSPRTTSRP